MNTLVFVFGASCSGKSTLTKALQRNLGPTWTRIDRDDLIEQSLATDETANELLDRKIKNIKDHVIIDAQIPWREKREGELYFLVLPPLKTLLERDEKRTLHLGRSIERAHYAKGYVIKTHEILDAREGFDYHFDSSQLSVADEVKTIRAFLPSESKSNLYLRYIGIVIVGFSLGLICVVFMIQKNNTYKSCQQDLDYP